MNKKEFLEKLKFHMSGQAESEINDVIVYYEELISDKIDNGENEEEIIDNLGSIDEIVKKLGYEREMTLEEGNVPIFKKMKNYTSKGMSGSNKIMFIILFIFASPFLLVMASVIFAVLVSILAAIFAVVVSVIAVIFSLGVSSVFMLFFGLFNITQPYGIFAFGIGIFIIGLYILIYRPIMNFTIFLYNETMKFFKFLKRKMLGGK